MSCDEAAVDGDIALQDFPGQHIQDPSPVDERVNGYVSPCRREHFVIVLSSHLYQIHCRTSTLVIRSHPHVCLVPRQLGQLLVNITWLHEQQNAIEDLAHSFSRKRTYPFHQLPFVYGEYLRNIHHTLLGQVRFTFLQ